MGLNAHAVYRLVWHDIVVWVLKLIDEEPLRKGGINEMKERADQTTMRGGLTQWATSERMQDRV